MKKILSMLLSLALVSASFVTAMAEGKPYVSYDVTPLDSAVYESVTYATLPDGASAYQIVIDFNNLPDLTYGRSGAGTRLGGFTVKLFTDKVDSIKQIYGINAAEAAEDWGAALYGCLKVAQTSFAANSLDNSLSIVHVVTDAANGFPYDTAGATKDVDGVLADALVLYVAATEEPVFTSVLTDALINNGGLTDKTNTKVTEFFDGVAGNINSDGSYNVGVEAGIDDVTSPVSEATFDFVAADGTAADYSVGFTTVESGSVKVALNITNVPAGTTFQFVGSTLK